MSLISKNIRRFAESYTAPRSCDPRIIYTIHTNPSILPLTRDWLLGAADEIERLEEEVASLREES